MLRAEVILAAFILRVWDTIRHGHRTRVHHRSLASRIIASAIGSGEYRNRACIGVRNRKDYDGDMYIELGAES